MGHRFESYTGHVKPKYAVAFVAAMWIALIGFVGCIDSSNPKPTVQTSTVPTPTDSFIESEEAEPKKNKVEPNLSHVRPGAYCDSRYDVGTYKGKLYYCKGPGHLRWRR